MRRNHHIVMLCAYVAVILAAPTLREPWMVATQAAVGAILFALRLSWFLRGNKRTGD